MKFSRRRFMQAMVAAGAAGGMGMARAQGRAPQFTFGNCAAPDKAAALKAAGFEYLEGTVAETLKPNVSDAEFAPALAALKACALPVRACNCFFSKEFRLTGPDAAHGPALDYAVKACRRADEAGLSFIVLGSGGSRRLPEGFAPSKGKEQFIAFCRKLGDRIRDCRVTVVLEPLPIRSTNLLNKVAEGIDYVDAIDRPRIQLMADICHMLSEKESPDSIRKAGARLRHCHIAELKGGAAPGTHGEDFRGYFSALRDIGYAGCVSCECAWPRENIDAAWRKAIATLREQSRG